MKVLRVFAGLTLVLALAGVVLGALALGRSTASPNDVAHADAQIKSLRADLRQQQAAIGEQKSEIAQQKSTIASLQQSTTAGQVSSLEGTVAGMHGTIIGLRGTVSKLTTCVPQIQTELGGMSIQQSTQRGYVTNAFISNPTIISSDCTKLLYGSG